MMPDRKKEKKKFSQGAMTINFLGGEALKGAHNALTDVQVLQQLVKVIGIDTNTFQKNTKSISTLIESKKLQNLVNLRKSSLKCYKTAISHNMITKLAKAGIDKNILSDTYKEGGSDGVKMLLSTNVGKGPRITNHKITIERIIKVLSSVIT